SVTEDGRIVYLGVAWGYGVRFEGGLRIYFGGDTSIFGDMRLIGEMYQPAIAFLPIGDLYTMGPEQAAKACELLRVKQVVPMHYGTFPALTGTPDKLRELVEPNGVRVLELTLVIAMTQQTNLDLPPNLPRPKDDGGARHLKGMALPDLTLPSTSGRLINLSKITAPRMVIYAYPMTGRPDRKLPEGWDDIPGARGCTPETCGFRDHHKDLAKLHADVFGVSTQSTDYQQEMVKRLEVPFEVLSDDHLLLTRALNLPTFTVDGMTLMKRLTLVVKNGRIEHVFYPVFPPDKHAEEVIAWLKHH